MATPKQKVPKIDIVSPCPGFADHEPLEFECRVRPNGVMFDDITTLDQGPGFGKPVHIRICKNCKVLYAEF